MSEATLTPTVSIPLVTMHTLCDAVIRNSFVKLLEKKPQGVKLVGAEIGVYEGINAAMMLMLCDYLELYLVDSYNNLRVIEYGDLHSKAFRDVIKFNMTQNLSFFGEKTKYVPHDSEEAVKFFGDNFFDYVYIDGDHTRAAALRDLELWYPKVKDGGVIGGHDIFMDEVYDALQTFLEKNKIPKDKWGMDNPGNGRSDYWICK